MAKYTPTKTPNVFAPSLAGSITYVLVMGLVIGLHQMPTAERYLKIPASFSLFRLLTGSLDRILTHAIGSSGTATVVVGLFWAVVGLAVYLFLQGLSRLIIDFSQSLDTRGYLWPAGADRNRGVIEALQRIGFRTVAGAGLILVTFGPLQRVLAGPVFMAYIGHSTVGIYIVWFLTGCLVLLLWTVLLRLVLLRPRLFS